MSGGAKIASILTVIALIGATAFLLYNYNKDADVKAEDGFESESSDLDEQVYMYNKDLDSSDDIVLSYTLITPKLEIVTSDYSSCTLSWNAVSDATSYEIYVNLFGDYILYDTTDETSYTVNNLSGAKVYSFYIVAVNDDEVSENSQVCSQFISYRVTATENLSIYSDENLTNAIAMADYGDDLQALSLEENGVVTINYEGTVAYCSADSVAKYGYVDVNTINQYGYDGGEPLNTGCELVSLCISLQRLGFDVTKNDIAEMADCNWDNADLNYCFVGDPYSSEGFGTFAPYIAKLATDFLSSDDYIVALHTDYYSGDNISGITFSPDKLDLDESLISDGLDIDGLKAIIDSGNVAIMWMTSYASEPYYDGGLNLYGGDEYTSPDYDDYYIQWVNSEHCVVLCGYDDLTEEIIVSDVATGTINRYSYDSFMEGYEMLGRQTVVISEK